MLNMLPHSVEVILIIAVAVTTLSAAAETRLVKWVLTRLVGAPFNAAVHSALNSEEVKNFIDERIVDAIHREMNGSIDHLNLRHDAIETALGIAPNPYVRVNPEQTIHLPPIRRR